MNKYTSDRFNLLLELESIGFGLEELDEVLSVVIEFFDDQHKANICDVTTCFNLVQFTQRYNTVLKMARDKVNNLNSDIKKVVGE